MGRGMVLRLIVGGHSCRLYDCDPKVLKQAERDVVPTADSLENLVASLEPPRDIWLSLPAGPPTEEVICQLVDLLSPGDTILDCSNGYYEDDVRRESLLAPKRIHYLDVGVSNGIHGLEGGYCLMVGGDPTVFDRLKPALLILAPGNDHALPRTPGRSGPIDLAEQGLLHCGPVGSGHLVKMYHNCIEYGVMQSLAEGFALLKSAASLKRPHDCQYKLDLAAIAELWRHKSVIRSWLLDLAAEALLKDRDLHGYLGMVSDSGEGRWGLQDAIDAGVPTPALAAALFSRFQSQRPRSFGDKLLSAMRDQFGGHKEGQ